MSGSVNRKVALPRLIFALILVLIVPILLMTLAGDWRWVEGWVFNGWWIGITFTPIFYFYFTDPAVLVEYFQFSGGSNQPASERLLSAVYFIGFLAWLVVMPLEARRFYWTAGFAVWLQWIGVIALVISTYLILDAYNILSYFSNLVQDESGGASDVASDGVYGVVRHPMYLGSAFFFIGGPLLLVSIYGLVIGIAMIMFIAVRIIGEEKILVETLNGYEDYRQTIRYRLIPGIW